MIAALGRAPRLVLQLAVAGIAGAVGLLGLTSPVALADTAPAYGIPATVTADALPTWQINGVVWAQVVVRNTVYVVGNFSGARPPGVAEGGAGEVVAHNVFAYDITTGNRVASFSHQLSGQGNSIAASPDGSKVYVGGDFTTVDGQTRSHIAAFNTATNALDPTFKPVVESRVTTIVATTGSLYIGGYFRSVNSVARKHLAAFNRSTGALLPWEPMVLGGTPWSMVMAPGGSRLIVGGNFTALNAATAYGMGSVSASSGATLPWAANQTIKNAGKGGAITSLATDGTQIFGSGYSYGRGSNFEGTFAANPTTGAINWVNDCHGDTYSVFPIGQVLYTAGHAHSCQSIGAFPNAASKWIGASANSASKWIGHRALAFTTFPTGTNTGPDEYKWNYSGLRDSSLLQWFPTLTVGTFTRQHQAAWSVSGNSDYVVLGGEFLEVNGIAQQGLVRFAVSGIAPNKVGPTPSSSLTPEVATSPSSGEYGSVLVTWLSTWDADNVNLTYQLFRDGAILPTYTTTTNTSFWDTGQLSFLDPDLPIGSVHTYQVQVSDSFGNTVTSRVSGHAKVGDQPPVASIATPTCSNLTCSFDGSGSTDPDGRVASYTWNFEDRNAPVLTAMASHTYAAAGTYQVQLAVNDGQGGTDIATVSVTVTAPPNVPPTAVIRVAGCANRVCSFDGSGSTDSDGTVTAYVWDFGDGSVGTVAQASHTYAQAGSYAVTLMVTDNDGATNTVTTTLEVSPASTRTTLTVAPSGTSVVGTVLRLTATTSPGAAGTTAFFDAGILLGRVVVSHSAASLSTSKLSVARHLLRAVFTPADTDKRAFLASSSPVTASNVVKAASVVALKLSAANVKYGAAPKASVIVSLRGTAASATGCIQIMDGRNRIKNGVLHNGAVTVTLPILARGTHNLTVIYVGSFAAGRNVSAPKVLTISK